MALPKENENVNHQEIRSHVHLFPFRRADRRAGGDGKRSPETHRPQIDFATRSGLSPRIPPWPGYVQSPGISTKFVPIHVFVFFASD
jgi:hypothetical protein